MDGELLVLDEALSFDEAGTLASEHQDIIAELAKWLATHDDVLELTIEAHSIGDGSKRVHQKRSLALAQQIKDALVAEGITAERLLAVGLGKSPDEQRHVTLRISKRAEQGAAAQEGQP
jgi:outer membrane protein OmpA-like peptidoglycan-associated protein